jgi:hypothetical protein
MAATGVRLAATSLRTRSWGYEVGVWIRGAVDCPGIRIQPLATLILPMFTVVLIERIVSDLMSGYNGSLLLDNRAGSNVAGHYKN